MNKGPDRSFYLPCYAMVMSLACWIVSPLGTNLLVPSPVNTHRMWPLDAQVSLSVYVIPIPTRSFLSQTWTSVLRTMEGVTRPVPTLSGATSVVARVAICSTRMAKAVTVSKVL